MTTLVLKQRTLKGGFVVCTFNPLASNIKEQNLFSCPHTFLTKVLGRSY